MTTQLQKVKKFFHRPKVANKIEACWWEQGVAACQMGLSSDNLNPVQLAGYKAAMTVRRELVVKFGR